MARRIRHLHAAAKRASARERHVGLDGMWSGLPSAARIETPEPRRQRKPTGARAILVGRSIPLPGGYLWVPRLREAATCARCRQHVPAGQPAFLHAERHETRCRRCDPTLGGSAYRSP